MDENQFCIIMAGGIGRRFWPLSRQKMPKQFIDLLGTGATLIQQTYERMLNICPNENIYVVSGVEYKELIKKQLPELNPDNILAEPTRRNTAPCIAFANERIRSVNPNATIIVTPSDHLIFKEERFIKVLREGIDFVADKDALLTIGIKPVRPEINYGYIQIEDTLNQQGITKVKNFTEKPDAELANFFVESGEFFWNSGIYIWSLKSITSAFELYLPDIHDLFSEKQDVFGTSSEDQFINEVYAGCKNISIDYGIMEKAENVYVYCADFGWSDLGTWSSLFDNYPKTEQQNVLTHDNILTYETRNTVITTTPNKMTAIHGLDDFIVAETSDALLICKKSEEERIREIINDIKFKKGDEYI